MASNGQSTKMLNLLLLSMIGLMAIFMVGLLVLWQLGIIPPSPEPRPPCKPNCAHQNLAGIDLSGEDLSGVNFEEAILSGADLSGANLSGANFTRAILPSTNLNNTTLITTNFTSAIMTGTFTFDANFTGAVLNNANMQNAALSIPSNPVIRQQEALQVAVETRDPGLASQLVTQLTEIQDGAIAIAGSPEMASGTNLRDSRDLRNANLQGALLAGIDLSNADLRDANLAGANLIGANLAGADLRGARLEGSSTNLTGANLVGANLQNAQLNGANLTSANLSNAQLQRANLQGANLTGARLTNADLTEANVSEAQLNRADLSGAILTKTNFLNANLQNANLSQTQMQQANLGGAELRNASLVNADLSGAILQGANLENADLEGAIFQGAILSLPSDVNPQEISRQAPVSFRAVRQQLCPLAGTEQRRARFTCAAPRLGQLQQRSIEAYHFPYRQAQCVHQALELPLIGREGRVYVLARRNKGSRLLNIECREKIGIKCSAGKPVPVVDPDGNVVPAGEAGEFLTDLVVVGHSGCDKLAKVQAQVVLYFLAVERFQVPVLPSQVNNHLDPVGDSRQLLELRQVQFKPVPECGYESHEYFTGKQHARKSPEAVPDAFEIFLGGFFRRAQGERRSLQ